jgi:S1-C subfamily serine protease
LRLLALLELVGEVRRRAFLVFLGWIAVIPIFTAQAQTPGMPASCGAIGVEVRKMTTAFAQSLGMAAIHGAIFGRPTPGGPAARAGIQAGDVVTAINGTPVMNWRRFTPTIAAYAPNTRITLNTRRSRQLIIVSVALGAGKCPPAKARQAAGST